MGFGEAAVIRDTHYGEDALDGDYYVIDEPSAPHAEARDPHDHRVVREQLMESAPSGPRLLVYWTAPMDVDWDD